MKATITNQIGQKVEVINGAHGETLTAMSAGELIERLEKAGELENMKAAGCRAVWEWVQKHGQIEAPRIARTAAGEWTVINGRHRLLELYSRGFETIYVEVVE